MTVTQVQLAAAGGAPGGGAAPLEPMARVDLGDLAQQSGDAQRLGNPQALGNEMAQGLRDLLRRSEEINRVVGEDFLKAQARIEAREAGRAIGMPGLAGMIGTGQAPLQAQGVAGWSPEAGRLMAASLPGPASRHPGAGAGGPGGVSGPGGGGFAERWDHLQDTYDRAFVRYTEFAAYQIQASELQKITEQLSNAINSLVRAS